MFFLSVRDSGRSLDAFLLLLGFFLRSVFIFSLFLPLPGFVAMRCSLWRSWGVPSLMCYLLVTLLLPMVDAATRLTATDHKMNQASRWYDACLGSCASVRDMCYGHDSYTCIFISLLFICHVIPILYFHGHVYAFIF